MRSPFPPRRFPPPGLRPIFPGPPMRGGRMQFGQRGPPPPGMHLPPNMRGMRPMGPPAMRPQMGPGFQNGRVMKKNRPLSHNLDLSKPWVTDLIKEEVHHKGQLLMSAKATQLSGDWSKFRDQREKCSKLYTTVRAKYMEQHAEEAHLFVEDAEEQEEDDFYEENASFTQELHCNACDKDFYSHEACHRHKLEHKTCGIDGCTFAAHEKIIEKHIEMQHVTGLYDKIRCTQTPEDIKKWIAERKKKYPSSQNVELRYKKQEEMLKRGERLLNKPQRFEKKKSFQRQGCPNIKKRPFKKRQQKQRIPETTLINEKCDWNGEMFPFRGTQSLYDSTTEEECDFDDSEWNFQEPPPKEETPTKSSQEVETKNVSLGGLSLLMGAYSDSGESETETPAAVHEPQILKQSKSDDEGPAEEKILYEPEPAVINVQEVTAPIVETQKRKRQVGHRKKKAKKEVASYYKRRRVTLLEKLLDNEIRHERNVILQCVRYVVNMKFFDET